jgi:hypothetical protein
MSLWDLEGYEAKPTIEVTMLETRRRLSWRWLWPWRKQPEEVPFGFARALEEDEP